MAVLAWGFPGCGHPWCCSLESWELGFTAVSQGLTGGSSCAAKPAQAPQASLELEGFSDVFTESSSPMFASSAPFRWSSASFCPLLWLFWNLALRHAHQWRGSELLQPSTSSAMDSFLSRNNDKCWWGARFDIHSGVQKHAISNFAKI